MQIVAVESELSMVLQESALAHIPAVVRKTTAPTGTMTPKINGWMDLCRNNDNLENHLHHFQPQQQDFFDLVQISGGQNSEWSRLETSYRHVHGPLQPWECNLSSADRVLGDCGVFM
ncbi:hypothetical protein ATANTOWER_003995 [Ataeniobius toweri]|uniref:Uncharacterized protein n=1 Tax=Ataeniobius toweri TaxID=208326 RepID=A0ABU7AEV2_9TELE|nr:hypothetical protein [Ataeniobius toweri]